MKKLEIEKTKPTFIISTFKTDIIKVGLVFSISNFFIAKTSLANNWRSFSSSYLALNKTCCACDYKVPMLIQKIVHPMDGLFADGFIGKDCRRLSAFTIKSIGSY